MGLREDAERVAGVQAEKAQQLADRDRARRAKQDELHALGREFAAEATRLRIPTTRLIPASGMPWSRTPAVRGWVVRRSISGGKAETNLSGLSVSTDGVILGADWSSPNPRGALAEFLAKYLPS